MRVEFSKNVSVIHGSQNDDNAAAARQGIGVAAKDLPDQPFATVPLHGVPYPTARNHSKHGQGRSPFFAELKLHDKGPAMDAVRRLADLLKLALFAQAL